MRAKVKSPPRPTQEQSRVLRRISQNGGIMMLTHRADGPDEYVDRAGITVPARTAAALIRNGWVIPQRDSMFDLAPQTWRTQ